MERLEQTGRKHFKDGKEIIARKKTNNKWFETQDSTAYSDVFFKRKIAWGNLSLGAQYAIVDEDYYINAPSTIISPAEDYLLALLNSKLADWYLRKLCVSRSGGYVEYKPMFIKRIPLPKLSEENKSYLSDCVARIYRLKHDKEFTETVEAEIDRFVYALFSLDVDEIRVVDSEN